MLVDNIRCDGLIGMRAVLRLVHCARFITDSGYLCLHAKLFEPFVSVWLVHFDFGD